MIPFLAALLGSTQTPTFPLTVESIMRGPALVGHAPRALKWTLDSQTLRFSWAKADGTADPSYRNYVVRADGTGLGVSTAGSNAQEGAEEQDGLAVYAADGDIVLYDLQEKKTRKLTATTAREDSPIWVRGQKKVIYSKEGNLFQIDLADGTTTQLTDIRPFTPPPPTPAPVNASQSALVVEQDKLFKDLGPSAPTGPRQRRRTGGGGVSVPATVTLPEGYRAGDLTVAPSGAFATLELVQDPEGDRIANVPSYVTRSGYTEDLPTYEKVGDRQGRSKLWILDLKKGEKTEMAPARPGTIGAVSWSPDGAYMVSWIYAEDHKEAWIACFDAATMKGDVRWTEHDDAWVGGPGNGRLGWLPDGSRFYFQSEKTGFSHLMTLSPKGGEPTALTSGRYEISEVALDAERNRFLVVSSEGSPFRRHVDAIAFDGTKREKIVDLSADDDAAYAISPDGKHVAVIKSEPNHPAELYLDGKKITETPSAEWQRGPWISPPIVTIPARDGVGVPGHFYKPKGWKKGGPAVVFVHGAGYLQNVYDGWSYYYREYMFHHVLMSRGYAVLDLDYRGSAGHGRDWRTAIYRHMGGKDLTDQVDGAKWLVQTQGVDPKRIGIYGGSYGGFITLMAMFTTPGTFAAGAALRPVTDWAHYNHGYTSAILNNPQDDKEAYRQSSPIYFAEGLKGALLICHGMVDTNVHFQDSVRLTQRLIELGKTNFELAPYPIENHAFRHPESWTDEYRRILALFERTIGNSAKKG